MASVKNIFIKKKILIYGLGKSGLSSFKFLKKKSKLFLFDDNLNKRIYKKKIINNYFDYIILSPGIDINKCYLKSFLNKNRQKIVTDFDVFFSFYKNKTITITGTNGKSTTSKILHKVLIDQNYDARLVGNIGRPILSEKKITKKTIFIIEASSYQLDYSKIFKSNISILLNISPDHIERHGTMKKYIDAKFKLIKNQSKNALSLINIKDLIIKKEIKNKHFISKIIKVNPSAKKVLLNKIKNVYFESDGNKQNLSFVIKISEILKLNKKKLFKSLRNFRGLNYRQQIIYKFKNLTIINDSKSTSYSSTVSLLKSLKNVYWILGGIPKKNDRFILKKKNCKNFKAFIFGNNANKFYKDLKNKMNCKKFKNLNSLINSIFLDFKKKENYTKKKVLLFSPAAASFDTFKNFEERGRYFNKIVKKYANGYY